MLDDLDKVQPATALHAEAELVDSDQDGTRDSARAAAHGVHMKNRKCGDAGPVEVCGRHDLDVMHAEGSARVSTSDRGVGAHASAEAAMVEHSVGGSIGPAGDEGANPNVSGAAGYKIAGLEGEGDVLLVDDGRRNGFGLLIKAEAEALSAKAEGGISIPFFDWSLDVDAYAEVDIGVGGGVGSAQYYNNQEQRYHWNAMTVSNCCSDSRSA